MSSRTSHSDKPLVKPSGGAGPVDIPADGNPERPAITADPHVVGQNGVEGSVVPPGKVVADSDYLRVEGAGAQGEGDVEVIELDITAPSVHPEMVRGHTVES